MTNSRKEKENSGANIFIERIKNKIEFENIYGFGKTVFSNDRKVKANYLFTIHKNQTSLNYAVAVSSKNGNSVWRSRFKRLIRESIRAEIIQTGEIILPGDSSLSIIFSPGVINQSSCEKIFLKDIRPAVSDLLIKTRIKVVMK
ncbi:MAG: ribonuclease P protein component [Ignavibacteriaceae bacterium]